MNTNTEKHRYTRVREIFKTVLLCMLLVSLILLVTVYIVGSRVYERVSKDGPGADFDKLWSVQDGTASVGLDGTRLLPDFIGYRQASSDKNHACAADYDALYELYDLTKPCLLELFGKDSVCRKLSPDEGKNRFDAAKRSDEFVYLRYHTPVLYQLIYAYSADKLTISEEDVARGSTGSIGAYVSELIIIPDKDFAAHRFIALTSDSEGNYYEFRPSDHIVASDFYISKLAGSGVEIAEYSFSFLGDECFESAQPFINEQIEIPDIINKTVDFSDESIREALLLLFEYNPDKLDGYADSDSYVYVDLHSQLRLGNEGISFFTYDATDINTLRGIRIDSLLGYTVSDTSGLFDKLTAVDNLIRRLGDISPELIGGEGKLCLGDVYSDGALLVIEYFLTHNGIRVGDEPYLRAVLTEKTICELSVNPTLVCSDVNTTLALNPAYILRSLGKTGALDKIGAADSVRLRYDDTRAQWMLILEAKSK